MNEEDSKKLNEIYRLLEEAYDYYFEHSDGHCKSSEGTVTLHFGNYWERKDKGPHISSVEVYSYVLGPHRSHWFDSLDQALAVVREWHAYETSLKYDKHGSIASYGAPYSTLYQEIEDERGRKLREEMGW